jgi:ketosteroid isomerase-like protein
MATNVQPPAQPTAAAETKAMTAATQKAQDSDLLSEIADLTQPERHETPADDEVWKAVQAWAASWADSDLDAHAAHYAPGFQGTHANVAAWRAAREALLKSSPRRWTVSDPVIRVDGDDARIHFRQTTRADGQSPAATVERFMRLRRLDGRWKIVIESAMSEAPTSP